MKPLEKVKEAYCHYIELSRYLFGLEDESVYDVNEIPEDSKFYQSAHELADSMKIPWKTMTHEDSNRIMLAMLDDAYNAIGKAVPKKDKKNLVIELNFKIAKKNGNNKKNR